MDTSIIDNSKLMFLSAKLDYVVNIVQLHLEVNEHSYAS